MGYSDWQIRQLRMRLAAYRLHRHEGGRPRPWAAIVGDIAAFRDTARPPDETDALFMSPERLHKFVEGESKRACKKAPTPSEDKLALICDFLMEDGYLTAEEFAEPDEGYGAAMALREFLAPAPVPGSGSSRADADYYTVLDQAGEISERLLTVQPSPDGGHFQVLELRNSFKNPKTLPFASWRKNERRYNFKRRDCFTGWAVRDVRGLFILFLKHEDSNRRDNYAYASPVFGHVELTGLLRLAGFEGRNDEDVISVSAYGEPCEFRTASAEHVRGVLFDPGNKNA